MESIINELIKDRQRSALDQKAITYLSRLFRAGIVKPFYEKQIKINGKIVWRFKWNITKDLDRQRCYLDHLKFINSDINKKVYVLDVYIDNAIDYII